MTHAEALFERAGRPAAMRAAVTRGPGQPLRICEVPVPRPGAGQVLVRLAACGICHTDLHMRANHGPPATPRPLILGHEGIGDVVALGESVEGWHVGERIGVPWLHDTCGRCPECLDGAESFCQAQRAHGFNVDGAFADYVVVDARYGVRLPAGIDALKDAPLLCAGVTAYGAVKTARLGLGRRCAVFGCGGLGLFAIQLAVRAGASVVALDICEQKLARARALGAQHAMMADAGCAGKLQSLGGMHACINFAPTDRTWAAMLGGIRPRGIVVAAAMVGTAVPVSQEWLTATGVTITGTSVGTRLEMDELMRLHAEKPLVSDTQVISLAAVNDGLDALERGEVSGRLVIALGDGTAADGRA